MNSMSSNLDSFTGKTEKATQADAETGTDNEKWMSALRTKQAVAASASPTKTFANVAARLLAIPDFVGQVGVQADNLSVYIGASIAIGSWTPILSDNYTSATVTVGQSTVDFDISSSGLIALPSTCLPVGITKPNDAAANIALLSVFPVSVSTIRGYLSAAPTEVNYKATAFFRV